MIAVLGEADDGSVTALRGRCKVSRTDRNWLFDRSWEGSDEGGGGTRRNGARSHAESGCKAILLPLHKRRPQRLRGFLALGLAPSTLKDATPNTRRLFGRPIL